jgi:hypothetical protein
MAELTIHEHDDQTALAAPRKTAAPRGQPRHHERDQDDVRETEADSNGAAPPDDERERTSDDVSEEEEERHRPPPSPRERIDE